MSQRKTQGTLNRDARMNNIDAIAEGLRLESSAIAQAVGKIAELRCGMVVEIIGVANDNPLAPVVEWLAGDEEGTADLYSLKPTGKLPAHFAGDL